MKHSKFIVTLLAAAALLALAVGSAGARSFRTSEKNFEIIWSRLFTAPRGPLTFRDNGGHVITCNVTLLGGYTESTIAKTVGAVGRIRHGSVEGCVGGTAQILNETLPWTINYVSFTGTLPIIRTIRTSLVGSAFKIRETNGVECLAGTTTRNPAFGEIEVEARGVAENFRVDETVTIPLGGGFLCSFVSPGRFEGTALIRNLPQTAVITVTLI